ncbi:mechanosensitive ion channel family protein [Thalassococcus sp. S3]|uniref:mechanosensitive ion channel family protein n=1 Tax=Thalassococcus sp. S3 TaxID=2017482 RepID=UPI0010248C10|nr:mechanosensitive ion channel family protein [Thalassococcus sp. S3]QBF33084.1 mechanosensitive ion channel protein MscS [Thalassococcus sp. S3]
MAAPPLTAQDVNQPTGTITVEDSASRDAAIAVRIRDILGELEGYDNVTVTVSSGIVTLRGTTLDAASAARLNNLAGRVEGVVAIENNVSETTDVVERLNPAVDRFKARLAQLLAFLPLIGVALAAFFLVVFIGILLARLRNPWERIAPNAFIADIYRQIVRLVFIVGGLVVALDILGATALLGTILGAAGIVGLAIGFAVRDTVENFIASIMLSIRQPFRPNDAVEINGDEGKVIRLTSRATILLSFDGNHIRIPNSTVFKSRIVNYSRNAERRFVFDLGLAPDTDLAQARSTAEIVIRELPFVLTAPAPSIWINGVGDSTITLRIAAWIDQRETDLFLARGEAIRLLTARFAEEGIDLPEPTYRLLTEANASATQSTPDKPTSREKAVDASPVADTDASAEHALEEIVNAERDALKDSDLLNRDDAKVE